MKNIKDLVEALQETGPDAPLRLRQGVIVSLQGHTATVTVAGSATPVSGIHYASSCCPVPGATCWLSTDGRDWFILATLAPTGPAFGTMRKSTAQTIGTASFTDMVWGSRTDVTATGVTAGSAGFTVQVPGIYSVSVSPVFEGNATGQRHSQIIRNGAAVAQGASSQAVSTQLCRLNASALVKCAAGDVINAAIYQNSGANLSTAVGDGSNVLSVTWLGPAA